MTISPTNPKLRDAFPSGDDGGGTIVSVKDRHLMEATERLVAAPGMAAAARRTAARRFIEYASTNRISLDSMWAWLTDGGELLATVLAVPSPGRTCMVFVSEPMQRRDTARAALVVQHALTRMAARECDLAQSLLEFSEDGKRNAMIDGGFRALARLSYLQRPVPTHRQAPPINPPGTVRFRPFSDEIAEDVMMCLDESYEGTLDCPELRGLRKTRDILAGHRATGAFEPECWTLMYIDDAPAGVLFLNPSPGSRSIELVYLGLAPPARGQGYGRLLLRHGLSLIAGRRERLISLAVDERNAPALSLYMSEGFKRALRRLALIAPLKTAKTPAE